MRPELAAGDSITIDGRDYPLKHEFEQGEGSFRAFASEDDDQNPLLIWLGPADWLRWVVELFQQLPEEALRCLPEPLLLEGQTLLLRGPSAKAEPFVDKQWRQLDNLGALDAIDALANSLQQLHDLDVYFHGIKRRDLLLDPVSGTLQLIGAPRLRPRTGADEEIWRDLRLFGELLFENFLQRDYPGGHQLAAILQERSALAEAGIIQPGLPQVLAGCVTPYGDLAYLRMQDLLEGLGHLRAELEFPLQLTVGQASTLGTYIFRRNNQDSCGYVLSQTICGSRNETLGFFCVADGIGGIQDGERASGLAVRTACDAFARAWQHYGGQAILDQPIHFARAVTKVVGQALAIEGEFSPDDNRGGTTFTGALIAGRRLALAHIGDSRAYLHRQGRIIQLSEDHTLVNILVKLGELDPNDDHSDNPSARTIARFLSTATEIEAGRIDSFRSGLAHELHVDPREIARQGFALRDGDLLILTSDGAHGEIDEDAMSDLIDEIGPRPQQLADTIVERACLQIGRDNSTVLILHVRA